MPRQLQNLTRPIIYLITKGATTSQTTPASKEFTEVLHIIEKAVEAEIPLVQIREKALTARVLYSLTSRAAELVAGTKTRLVVNDGLDIARAAGADGVHLSSSKSLPARVVRANCPMTFIIGVSTHDVVEVATAKSDGADLIVFGPVFDTESKRAFGEPQGLKKLAEVTQAVQGFPVLAIGGITLDRAADCFRSGAAGIAAISLLNDAKKLRSVVDAIRQLHMDIGKK